MSLLSSSRHVLNQLDTSDQQDLPYAACRNPGGGGYSSGLGIQGGGGGPRVSTGGR